MKNKKNFLRVIIIILIIIWAVFVFYMSHQQGTESSGLSKEITAIFFKTEELINFVEPIVRKIAHFTEYALGGVLFISLFLTYEWPMQKRVAVSIGLGVWYAILDEIHQLFVPNRSGNIIDVGIDSLGIICGVCFMIFIYKTFKNYQKKKEGV